MVASRLNDGQNTPVDSPYLSNWQIAYSDDGRDLPVGPNDSFTPVGPPTTVTGFLWSIDAGVPNGFYCGRLRVLGVWSPWSIGSEID